MLGVRVLTLMVKLLLTALARPVAAAVNCLPLPAALTWTLAKLSEPLPALVPMSSAVVPASGPVPAVKVSVTVLLAPRPTAELLPNVSWLTSVGGAVGGGAGVAELVLDLDDRLLGEDDAGGGGGGGLGLDEKLAGGARDLGQLAKAGEAVGDAGHTGEAGAAGLGDVAAGQGRARARAHADILPGQLVRRAAGAVGAAVSDVEGEAGGGDAQGNGGAVGEVVDVSAGTRAAVQQNRWRRAAGGRWDRRGIDGLAQVARGAGVEIGIAAVDGRDRVSARGQLGADLKCG